MPQTRQLAAIMFTDIVGYTALMGDNEQKAFEILTKSREIQKPIIEKYNGRWIKDLGDGVLASFTTVSDAVYAAKEIQEQTGQTQDFSLRIGIHLGEIILEDGDVFGDAVNISSRLQTLAPVGGIYISEAVERNISNKKDIATKFVRKENLRNVKDPVHIYEIITGKVSGIESKLQPGVQLQKNFLLQPVLIITGIIILFAIIGFIFLNKTARDTGQIISIAVMPFENRSTDPDTEYLSDGLAESLIYRLSQLPNLQVSPTSSVFRYKGKETELEKIANELQVNHIMSGRIIQQGENLTISIELVDVRHNKLIWGEQYERKSSELLATQREIANEVAQNLPLKLSANEKGLTKHYTQSNEAYQQYLRGKYHFAKRTKDDMQRALEYFLQAVQLDPNFALAYASIAESFNNMPFYPYLSPKEAFPKAKAATQKALEIDPTLPEAHTALANYFAVYDWNWEEADREFKRAIELDPNNSGAHFRYGQFYLSPLGRHSEATTELKKAIQLEPLSLNANSLLTATYIYAGQNDLALEQARKTYDLEPNFPVGRYYLGLAYIASGMYREAIAHSEKILQSDPTSQLMLRVAGCAYAKSDHRHKAEEVIKRFYELAKTQYVASYNVASVYSALGDTEKALAELEKAIDEKDWKLHRLKVDPLFDPLRKDPRFTEMLKRLNFAE